MRPVWNLPLLALVILSSCSTPYKKLAGNYHFNGGDGTPDYGLMENWAAHPYKKDPSDSIPRPLRSNYHPDSTVDVFFIHPTTYTETDRHFGQNAPIGDPYLAAKTDYSTILFQSSIFNEAGRVFAPRYRQAHLSSYFSIGAQDSAKAQAAFDLAYADVKAAFLYYLDRYNQGRPIIIASHSQGSTHAKRLLKELFEGKPLQQQLVVAYLAGMVVEPDYFSTLKPCSTPAETGCFCSWRSFKINFVPEFVKREPFTAIVTNPLTWNAAGPNAPRSANPGSVLRNFNKVLVHNVSASIHDGILWTSKPHFLGRRFFLKNNYHIADMNLFYVSIRNNAGLRVAAFRKKP